MDAVTLDDPLPSPIILDLHDWAGIMLEIYRDCYRPSMVATCYAVRAQCRRRRDYPIREAILVLSAARNNDPDDDGA